MTKAKKKASKKTKQMSDAERSYKGFLIRISTPVYGVPVPKEEQDEYNRTHPLPTEEDLRRIRKEAGIPDWYLKEVGLK